MKNIYVAALAVNIIISFIVAITLFFSFHEIAIILISLQVALLPLISHIRMRRQQASLKRLFSGNSHKSSTISLDNSKILRKIESLEEITRHIDKVTSQSYGLKSTKSEAVFEDLQEYAHEIRQESQMIRQIIELHLAQKES